MCDKFPRKFYVQTSYKPSDYVLGLIFVVNIKFPRASYHTIVPSTKELCCLIIYRLLQICSDALLPVYTGKMYTLLCTLQGGVLPRALSLAHGVYILCLFPGQ